MAIILEFDKKVGNKGMNVPLKLQQDSSTLLKAGTNYITADVAKKRKQRWPDNPTMAKLQGGKKALDFYTKVVQMASRQQEVSPVEPPKPTAQKASKPEIPKAKEIPMPNGKIKLAASVEPKKVMSEGKKVYITEEQVLKIKDYGKESN